VDATCTSSNFMTPVRNPLHCDVLIQTASSVEGTWSNNDFMTPGKNTLLCDVFVQTGIGRCLCITQTQMHTLENDGGCRAREELHWEVSHNDYPGKSMSKVGSKAGSWESPGRGNTGW
jgi:hypothetical protein